MRRGYGLSFPRKFFSRSTIRRWVGCPCLVGLSFMVVMWGGLAAPVSALEPCPLDEEFPKSRPLPVDGGPTNIHVKLFLFDLVDIVTVRQEFTLDLFLNVGWQDDRVVARLRKAGVKHCEVPVDAVWHPGLLNLNERSVTFSLPQVLILSDTGRVEGNNRLVGTYSAHFDLSQFPLDTQSLAVTYISTQYSPEELKVNFDASDHAADFTESSWLVEDIQAHSSRFDFGTVQDRKNYQYRFDYVIQVKRQTAFYIWKVFLPLCMIVAVSWSVFWVDPKQLGIQTGIGTGMMLNLIAFLFSLQDILPKISYLTRMDVFVYTSLTFVFAAFVEALITGGLAARGKEATAYRLDLICRFVFPLGFLGITLWFWQVI